MDNKEIGVESAVNNSLKNVLRVHIGPWQQLVVHAGLRDQTEERA